jgi:hypothetical protein
MTTISVRSPISVAAPRASLPAARLFTAVLSWFENGRQARDERKAVADRADEAAAVRQYALRFASHDPRFAADLLAAADRHERVE